MMISVDRSVGIDVGAVGTRELSKPLLTSGEQGPLGADDPLRRARPSSTDNV